MRYSITISIIFSLLIISCSKPTKQPVYNPLAIEYNNKAVEYMKIQKYDSALVLLDKAISIDKNYVIAYGNKTAVYTQLKDYKKALLETENQINIKPDFAEGFMTAGSLCDIIGDTVKAIDYYKKGIILYNDRIENSSDKEKSITNRINRDMLMIITGQESEGKEDLSKLKQENPNRMIIDEFLKMTRQSYLKTLRNR